VALEAGAHGVYAHPLEVGGEALGALNLYTHEPNMFAEEVQQIALQFARSAELLLAGVVHRLSQDEVIRQLHAAMADPSTVARSTHRSWLLASRSPCCPPRTVVTLMIRLPPTAAGRGPAR
jgi:hypothetical protein